MFNVSPSDFSWEYVNYKNGKITSYLIERDPVYLCTVAVLQIQSS